MAYFQDYEPGVPFATKENERSWNANYKKHKERLEKIKAGTGKASVNQTNGVEFLHLQLKLKKLQFEEDRYAHIDYENRKLLDRLIHIMKGPSGVDHWNDKYKKGRSLHDDYRRMQESKIRKENREIHNRLSNVRPMSLSAPAIPDLVNKTRERIRAAEDKKIEEENKVLKTRIKSVRSQISTTPISGGRSTMFPKSQLKSPPPRDLQSQQREINIRRNKLQSQPWQLQGKAAKYECPTIQLQREKIVEDNLALHNRLLNARGTIDFKEMERQSYKAPRKPIRRTVSAEEVNFIEDNLMLQRQMAKVVHSLEDSRMNSDSDERQKTRTTNVKSLKKAIRVENSIAQGYLSNRRQEGKTMKYGGFKGPYAKENYELHQRILEIKQGKRKVDIWRNTLSSGDKKVDASSADDATVGPRVKKGRGEPGSKGRGEFSKRDRVNPNKSLSSSGKGQKSEQVEPEEASDSFESIHSWGETKEDPNPKEYNVPLGYRKKFRKKRKKQENKEIVDNDVGAEEEIGEQGDHG